MDKKGKFIVIDGMDGSGKGVQIRLLQKKFTGKNVLFTREPGGTPLAEEIRAILLRQEGTVSNAVCDFFLFWASRGSHVEDVVVPAREKGMRVISDRYDSSTFAFQIWGEQERRLEKTFVAVRQSLPIAYYPDIYIFLDLPPEVAFERRNKDSQQEKSKFDIKPLAYHRRVRAGFQAFAAWVQKQEIPSRAFLVNADRTSEEIHQDIFAIIQKELTL